MLATYRWLPFLGVLTGVLVAGLRSQPIPQVFHHQDLLHHGVAFAALAFTACLALSKRCCWMAIVLSLLVAGGVELVQDLLPHRTASSLDMLADVLGIVLGYGLWYRVEGRLQKNKARAEPQRMLLHPNN